jgi:pilus assembly protein Flp/PilA
VNTIIKRLWTDEDGQDLVEYALIVSLLALSSVAAMQSLAAGISNVFSNAAANLTTAT